MHAFYFLGIVRQFSKASIPFFTPAAIYESSSYSPYSPQYLILLLFLMEIELECEIVGEKSFRIHRF